LRMLLDGRFISNSLDFSDANHMARMLRQYFSCTNWLESPARADLTLAGGVPHEVSITLVAPFRDVAKSLPLSRALPE
jgi:hypothetical protein